LKPKYQDARGAHIQDKSILAKCETEVYVMKLAEARKPRRISDGQKKLFHSKLTATTSPRLPKRIAAR